MIANICLGRCLRSLHNVTLWEGNDFYYRVYVGNKRYISTKSLDEAYLVFDGLTEEVM